MISWKHWRLLVLAAAVSHSAQASDLRQLHGHVPAAINRLAASGPLAATNQLRLAVGLNLRDPAGLDAFLAQLDDQASTNYHQYLSQRQFADRFGPSEQDYAAVKEFARSNGLAVAGTFDNRLVLDVMGPVEAIEEALHLHLKTYQHPTENRHFFAPDREPSVRADLPIADIQGLSDFFKPHPRVHIMNLARATTKSGSAPDGSGSYFGDDFRNAYVPGTALTGAGQMVGLLQFDGFYSNDIAAYAAAAGGGRANIPIQTVLLDGYNGVPTTGRNSGNIEVSLDIEQAMAMAPGLARIVVFEAGPYGSQNDILNSMVSYSATIKQLSSSWGWSGGPSTTTDNIYKNMIAAGQSFFNASGDSDAFTSGSGSANGVDNPNLANAPSSSPYITQVGATTLTMNGIGNSYGSETVWNWGLANSSYDGVGSSGGVSSSYSIPSWQTNVVGLAARGGSTTYRNIPDVALTGDEIYVIYGGSGQGSGGIGGTSCAAPLWAGFMALVNQQGAANGRSAAGFINPAIYTIAAGAGYASCFHDVTTGNNTWSGSPSLFYAQSGYDLCTGLGTPSTGLINALAAPLDTLMVLPSAGYAFSGPDSGPFTPASGSYELTNSSNTSLTWSLVNTSSWLQADVVTGTLAAHSAGLVNVKLAAIANSLGVGTYSSTIGFLNQTTDALQSFPCTLQVAQPLSLSPAKGFSTVGPVGGPFTPGSATLTLINEGNASVAWSLINTSTWLSASASSGIMAGGGSVPVTFSLLPAAATFPAGVYNTTVVVSNSLGVAAVLPFALLDGQPVIQNGGFETGDFTDWTQSGNTADTYVLNASNAGSSYIHSGTYAAILGPPNSLGYLTQNLTTAQGQNYIVSLWLRNPKGATPNEFQVQWNGVTLFDRTNITATGWTNLQFLVTASAPITPLQIGFRNDPSYFGLDDVNVTPLGAVSFNAAVPVAGNFQMVWNTTTGLVYQVQYATNLLHPNWINLGAAIPAKAATLTIADTNALGSSLQRFYRISVLP